MAARYAISAIFFVFGCIVGGWIPHIPEVKQALGLSNHVLGWALLSSAVGASFVMPLVGALIHRFGSRAVALVGGLAACGIAPWLVLEPSLTSLVANLFVLGLCYGCMDIGMNTHSVAVQNRHEQPILSSVHGWFSLGGFAGGAGAALAAWLHLTSFQHMAGASLLLAVVMLVSDRFLLPKDTDKDAEGPKFMVPHGVMLVLGLLCLCAFVSEGAVWEWGAVYLRNVLFASPELTAAGVGVTAFAMALSRFVGDGIIARLGYAKVLGASGVLVAAGVLFSVSVLNPYVAIAGFVLSSVGVANMAPTILRAAGIIPGVPSGVGLAAVTTCGYMGFLLGPPFIGFVADWRSLGFSLGLLSVLGITVTILGPRTLHSIPGADS